MAEPQSTLETAESVGAETPVSPATLTTFAGQNELKRNLGIYIEAARRRGESLDHVLFYGPPGLGKTTLASIIAAELDVNFRVVNASTVVRPKDLLGPVIQLNPRDVLFIDEIHRLPAAAEELLYTAMQDYKVHLIIDEDSEPQEIELNPFTLVGATTRRGLLTKPLIDRFGIQLRLKLYTPDELADVLRTVSAALNVPIDSEAIREVAHRARGTPRVAVRLFRRLRDFAAAEGRSEIDSDVAGRGLAAMGIDANGLEETDRRYLEVLNEEFDGGPVGVKTLATSLDEEQRTIEDIVEPFLMQQGYVRKTSRGRISPTTQPTTGTLFKRAP